MTLEYELGQRDFEAFIVHHAAHAPYIVKSNRRMLWVWGGLFALVTLVMAQRSPAGGVAFATINIISLSFYGRLNRWWYVRRNLQMFAGPDGPRFGATRLELGPDRLHVDVPGGRSEIELSAIHRIDESESHFFLYLDPVAAIIVPKSGDGVDGFVQALRSEMAHA